MEFRCPHCQSPIYSRKQKICGVCERPLPEDLLFSRGQIAFLNKQEDQIEKQQKEFHLPDTDYGSDIGGMSF
jgi:predicted amidophosphoribosyltransferase